MKLKLEILEIPFFLTERLNPDMEVNIPTITFDCHTDKRKLQFFWKFDKTSLNPDLTGTCYMHYKYKKL